MCSILMQIWHWEIMKKIIWRPLPSAVWLKTWLCCRFGMPSRVVGVLASSAYNADYLKQMQQLFRLDVHLVTEPELPDYADVRVMPWGWNPAIRKRMLKGGVLEKNLPTPDALDKYRMKAARSNAWLFAHFSISIK